MKKVISALTVAAMCASMAASTMPAFAVYKAGDVSAYLKVVDAGKGTVSDDGKTITFASAADAAGSKIVVGEYLVADTAAPSVQSVGALFTTDSTLIKLGNKDGQGVDYSASVGDSAEYTEGGYTFTTGGLLMDCFGYWNDDAEEYSTGAGAVTWGHSSKWQGDGWVGNGKNDVLLLSWATDFADDFNHPDDYKQTAHFISEKSDKYVFTQFDVNFDAAITDGTYSVDFLETYTHPEYGKKTGNYILPDPATPAVPITTNGGITIKIGDATVTTPTDAPETPTEAPTEKVETPTDAPKSDKSDLSEWTWYFDDVTYDPANEKNVEIAVKVGGPKDPGTYGFDFGVKIDGKDVADSDFKIVSITKGDAYPFGMFAGNKEDGSVGAAENAKEDNTFATAGQSVATYKLKLKDGVTATPGKKYSIEIVNLSAGNASKEKFAPATLAGSITIAGGAETPTDAPENPTDAPENPTDAPENPSEVPETPTDAPTPGAYIYGDVNEDGKVQLVDVVKLNRYLTGLDATLSDKAIVQANCYRNGEDDASTTKDNLDGKDSMEILKRLIDLVATLPTQA